MAGFFVVPGRATVYGAAVTAMANNPDGPVGRTMATRARAVHALAVARCPVESPESAQRHHRAAGRLKASIFMKRVVASNGVTFRVGSHLVFARRVEFNRKVGGYLRGSLSAAGGTIVGGVQ